MASTPVMWFGAGPRGTQTGHRENDPSHDIIHYVLGDGGVPRPAFRIVNSSSAASASFTSSAVLTVRRWLPNRQALRLLEPLIRGLGGLVAPNQLLSGHQFDLAEHVDLDQVRILTITGLRLGRLIAFRG